MADLRYYVKNPVREYPLVYTVNILGAVDPLSLDPEKRIPFEETYNGRRKIGLDDDISLSQKAYNYVMSNPNPSSIVSAIDG